jgi:hypothetical protein
MDVRVRRVLGNLGSEVWNAVPSIGEDPEPEVRALARAAQCAPGTTDKAKVQKNNGIGGTQPHLDDIVWAKFTVKNPAGFLSKLFL